MNNKAINLTEVSRPRVTVSFNEDVYEYLSQRAEKEVRTIANLIEFIVIQAKEKDETENKNNPMSDRHDYELRTITTRPD